MTAKNKLQLADLASLLQVVWQADEIDNFHSSLWRFWLCKNVHILILFCAAQTEYFQDKYGGVPKWIDDQTYYTFFTEGWGLYSENPVIATDTDTYKDHPMQRFGMLKWQVRLPGLIWKHDWTGCLMLFNGSLILANWKII